MNKLIAGLIVALGASTCAGSASAAVTAAPLADAMRQAFAGEQQASSTTPDAVEVRYYRHYHHRYDRHRYYHHR